MGEIVHSKPHLQGWFPPPPLLRLAKGTSRDETTLRSPKIKPVALAVIELCLSEGISKQTR